MRAARLSNGDSEVGEQSKSDSPRLSRRWVPLLQVDTIRNRIHCPLIDHALSACVRKVLIDLLAQHISLVGFFLAKIRLWLLSMWTANVRLCSQQSQTSVANSGPFLKALFLMQAIYAPSLFSV